MDPVKAARRGREAAFRELFDEHHLPLFRFAYRLTGSLADAEDIVQECFLELQRSFPHRGPIETKYCRPFLARKRTCGRFIREAAGLDLNRVRFLWQADQVRQSPGFPVS